MTRGIHLKRLKSTDLSLLGLSEGTAEEEAPDVPRRPQLAEADPALSRLIGEVRTGLEGALRLLEDALAATRRSDSGDSGPSRR